MNLLAGRPRAQDAVIAAGAAIFAVVALTVGGREIGNSAAAVSYLLVVVAGLSLLSRRGHAVAVLVVVAALRLGVTWESGVEQALIPAIAIALYTVARSGVRRTNIAVAVGVALVVAIGVAALDTESFVHEVLGEAGLLLLPIAVADAARSRADRLDDLINTEADRRVSAERLRVARDLHDVVAHGLSTIAIQSGVAAHLLDRDPTQAKEALEVINETGKSALEELRVMVGVLRSTDEAPLLPTPTDPNDLTTLLDGAAHAGIDMTVSIAGQFPAGVADSCVVALHRIVQEALTNVARHAAAAPTELTIQHRADDVWVSIMNEPGAKPDTDVPSTGVGIIGMRERAEALGGTLTATARDEGGFHVQATIPYNQRPTETLYER